MIKLGYECTTKYIKDGIQVIKKEKYTLRLSRTEIDTHFEQFPLEIVLDVSYKPFSDGSGLLYLHTNKGVFPFVTYDDTTEFINSYVKLKRYQQFMK
ncbi:hypothetical protein [Mangrovibacillus cuniculi]|uniref:hypothetical protein n=1 Tax=Mangrovibacillus cuniculi TaxID=2593652 RepID=UPI001EFA0F8E|nr:hypothetical protein [Mangrovibacillus cuniculi]